MAVKKRVVWKPQKLDPLTKKLQKQLVAIGYDMVGDIVKSMARSRKDKNKPRPQKRSDKRPVTFASYEGQPPRPITGRLMNSISVNWSNSGSVGKSSPEQRAEEGVGKPDGGKIKNGKKFKIVVGTNVQYAPFLEFGTRYIKARPFMLPAFQRHKKSIEAKLAAAGKKAIGTI